jgi:UDPglucose--hexose-1-phosphate uridylyltransferase
MLVRQTLTHLADGRELFYFDESGATRGDRADPRVLPPPPPPSQLRYDRLTDEWVAVASHRQERTFLPPSTECPLCPSTQDRATEIPAFDYDVVVFENRFPSFSLRGESDPVVTGSGSRPGVGRCEVVCFTCDHSATFAQLGPARVRTVIEVLISRTEALSAMPGVEQVFCFENRGVEIGVTLQHPHGQIYGYPYVTPRTRTMLAAAQRHGDRNGGDLFAELLTTERAQRSRVVCANEHWTAFVPVAARWPFEVLLAPHRRVPDLVALDTGEREALVPIYIDVLGRFDRLFDMPSPYVAGWHQAPVREGRDLAHLHLQVFSIRRAPGKLKYLAGSESAMGAFINDVAPEDAARRLREAGQ